MKNITIDALHIRRTKSNVRIWLTTLDGQILLSNKIYSYPRLLNLSDITIEADNLNKGMSKIEDEWGILVTEYDLELEYFESYKERGIIKNTDVYFLEIDLNREEKELVAKKSNGDFYDIKKFPVILNLKIQKNSPIQSQHFDMLFSVLMHKHNI